MKFLPFFERENTMNLPQRKSIRIKGFDYSTPGAYFVTICTQNRQKLFGIINNGKSQLNSFGLIVKKEIDNIESHYANVRIDRYIIMPDHLHMIIVISEPFFPAGINPCPTIKCDIPNIVGKFKASVTRNVGNAFMHSENKKIWQTSFYDHVIRNENDYLKICEYIETNALVWNPDDFQILLKN